MYLSSETFQSVARKEEGSGCEFGSSQQSEILENGRKSLGKVITGDDMLGKLHST